MPFGGFQIGGVPPVSNSSVSPSSSVFPAGDMRPKDHGFKFWTGDLMLTGVGAGTAFTAGTIHVVRLNTPGPSQAVTTSYVAIATIGATLTGVQAYEIVNPAGTVLATSPDQTANWSGSVGVKSAATAFSTPADSFVWFVFLSAGGTPCPALARVGQSVNQNTLNFNLTTANYRSATNTTGQSALPTPFVPGSNSTANQMYWVALN